MSGFYFGNAIFSLINEDIGFVFLHRKSIDCKNTKKPQVWFEDFSLVFVSAELHSVPFSIDK